MFISATIDTTSVTRDLLKNHAISTVVSHHAASATHPSLISIQTKKQHAIFYIKKSTPVATHLKKHTPRYLITQNRVYSSPSSHSSWAHSSSKVHKNTNGRSYRQDTYSTHYPLTAACVAKASSYYKVPQVLIYSILKTEGGRVGEEVKNMNNTYDIGPMQINSTWLPKLQLYGISHQSLLNDGCLNVLIGTWILAKNLITANHDDRIDYWRHVGNYNSSNPVYNKRYAIQVIHNMYILFSNNEPKG